MKARRWLSVFSLTYHGDRRFFINRWLHSLVEEGSYTDSDMHYLHVFVKLLIKDVYMKFVITSASRCMHDMYGISAVKSDIDVVHSIMKYGDKETIFPDVTTHDGLTYKKVKERPWYKKILANYNRDLTDSALVADLTIKDITKLVEETRIIISHNYNGYTSKLPVIMFYDTYIE